MLDERGKKKEYVKAGITLFLGLLILSVFMVVLGGHWFWEKLETYPVRFVTVKDLVTGRPVKYGGMDIGRILNIELDPADPRYIRVTLGVKKDFPLYSGTKARISQKGLVGDYYVFLDLQGEPGPLLEPGSEIPAARTMDMQELAAVAGDLLADVKPKIDEIAANIDELLSPENVEMVGRMLRQGPALLDDTKAAVEAFRRDWAALAEKGQSVAGTLDKTLTRAETAVGAVEDELRKTLVDFRAETSRAGKLADEFRVNLNYDQDLVEEILGNLNRTSRDLKDLMARLKERPWQVIRPPREEGK
ncbi:MlaD family protein [Desulfolutivibrio sulfoxidireducens]|uniref:MlaD family protein n=1 Tax=Desulfolutivibrio sulfoxidireducens TaxID=2773299 RepID=UPI00159E5BFA|nr:MlaD family protein [Desulfolutivibrio sulfoxidireducens]QLA14691.1 MCE family protein [Desulfolutivibrio sulfoxidireducens]QLA18273.1 MCE family protein [Desulfolutivibrio sulfoxidireducens]